MLQLLQKSFKGCCRTNVPPRLPFFGFRGNDSFATFHVPCLAESLSMGLTRPSKDAGRPLGKVFIRTRAFSRHVSGRCLL